MIQAAFNSVSGFDGSDTPKNYKEVR
jgi:hypothetical protein